MPKCRNCGTRLTKFDIDICPVCGTKDPLKGVSSDTLEVTSEISLDADISFKSALYSLNLLLVNTLCKPKTAATLNAATIAIQIINSTRVNPFLSIFIYIILSIVYIDIISQFTNKKATVICR